jgi:hypothetical protein
MRLLVLAGLLGLLMTGGGQAAHAHPNELALEVLPDQATLAADGRSMSFHISTRCDRKATVIDARASAAQPLASGEATFAPRCTRLPEVVLVTVPALAGSFQTGEAQVSVVLVVREGRTKMVGDSALLRVRPSVRVLLADGAVRDGGGEAALIDVTVTCPVAADGRGGQVTIYQGQVVGTGSVAPTTCDGSPRTVSVRVVASGGLFQVGSAEAAASVSVEEGGDLFPGFDLRTVQIR